MALRIEKQIVDSLKAARNGEAVDLSKIVIPRIMGGAVQRKEPDDSGGDAADNARLFKISNKAEDRDRDTIDPMGWDLTDFKRNGAILWSHNSHQPPIAVPGKTWVEGKGDDAALYSEAGFIEEYYFSKLILALVDCGALKNCSVGFMPTEWIINEDRRGIDFIKQKLVEWSVTPIGSNPEAMVQLAKAGDLDMAPMLDWSTRWLDGDEKIASAIADEDEITAIAKALLPWKPKADPGVPIVGENEAGDQEVAAVEPEQVAVADEGDNAPEQKRGRTISRANENKLRQAFEMIGEVLSTVAETEEDDDKAGDVPEQRNDEGGFTEPEVREIVRDAIKSIVDDDRTDEEPITAEDAVAVIRSEFEDLKKDLLRQTGRLPA